MLNKTPMNSYKKLERANISNIKPYGLEKHIAGIKYEIENPGFYYIEDKLVTNVDVVEANKDKLSEAPGLLNELAEV